MPDYLLEIGTEELPADQVPEAQARLKALMSEGLTDAHVKFGSISTMGTPRRLTCIIHDISEMQDTVKKKVAGPAVKASFDAAGQPTQAAIKFAEKNNLPLEALEREEVGGVEKLVANLTVQGKPVGEVLKELVPDSIGKLSGERLMRWGNCDFKFSRPIRWLVSLLGNAEVKVTLEDIESGRATFGNRVLAPDAVQVKDTGSYAATLKNVKVLADPSDRQKLIQEQVRSVATAVKGKPRELDGPLLEEVVNITEWPHAVLGEFEKEYLDLPDKLIETIMIHHQRYFPIERLDAGNSKHKLLPYFITVANNDRKEAQATIKQGNERVIRARLADGRFFYFDDQKTKLEDRKNQLGELTFQRGLGSYSDKVVRLTQTARILIDSLHLEPKIAIPLERTMELCKLDLVTNLVRELPELQGYVGSWYAELEGQPPEAANAIASHYAPRSQHDTIPEDTVGQFAALIDKLDNMVGLFALGMKPTASGDPYALRRQAQGVVDILLDGLTRFEVNVSALVETLLAQMEPFLSKKKDFNSKRCVDEVRDFLLQRVRTRLLDRGYGREIVEAVLAAYDPLANVPDVLIRCDALKELLSTEQGMSLVRIGVRIGGILTQASPSTVDQARFQSDAEANVWNVFQSSVVAKYETKGHFSQPRSLNEYMDMLRLLDSLVAPIDKFFEQVMVNDPDAKLKENRHGLLKNVYQYFGAVADFPKLQPLLP
jgi:glycyl-tRNA synthetase beta chain